METGRKGSHHPGKNKSLEFHRFRLESKGIQVENEDKGIERISIQEWTLYGSGELRTEPTTWKVGCYPKEVLQALQRGEM